MIIPFRIDIDPMERLLLVNFEKDRTPPNVGFEPQVFDDSINGKGHLVIEWRQDGRVDVYHQPGLPARMPCARHGAESKDKGADHTCQR